MKNQSRDFDNIPDSKTQDLKLTLNNAEKEAIKNGLDEKSKPFTYRFSWNKCDEKNNTQTLEFIVEGKGYQTGINNELNYDFIVLNPWTCGFIQKGVGKVLFGH